MLSDACGLLLLPASPQTSGEVKYPWFERVGYYDRNADERRLVTVVARCFGEHELPTRDEWAGLTMVGSYLASLGQKYLAPYGYPDKVVDTNMRQSCWQTLLEIAEQHRATNNEDLMALCLRWFKPRTRYADGPREMGGGCFDQSDFSRDWPRLTTSLMRSAGYLSSRTRAWGDEYWPTLPRDFQEAVNEMANHTLPMLELIMPIVRRKFYY
jgi:hypothetical protein